MMWMIKGPGGIVTVGAEFVDGTCTANVEL